MYFFQVLKSSIIKNVQCLDVFKVGSPFDRRITSLIWHPKLITTLAVGSKGGDIVLWNHQNKSHHLFIQGVMKRPFHKLIVIVPLS